VDIQIIETYLWTQSLLTAKELSNLKDDSMKRLVILVALVLLAGVAGIVVRSASRDSGPVAELKGIVSHNASEQVREEIRRSYELLPGAQVELSGLNGSVNIETSDSKTAEVFIERLGDSQEALGRRRVTVDADSNGLRIKGEKGDASFFGRLFGSSPHEKVTLKLPRQISLSTKGVNGSISVGALEGSVDVRGVNGRVQIAQAMGTADFKGVNGNIVVGLKELKSDGVTLSGINGNVELQLAQDLNADLEAHGMNGRVVSDLPGVTVEKSERGNYSARIGSGGNAISVKGINGNVRLTHQ
jgi:hypothetical protein